MNTPDQPGARRRSSVPLLLSLLLLLGGLLSLGGCARPSAPVLDPQGPAAARMAEVWWVLFAVTTAIFIAVMIFFFLALRRKARHEEERGARFARSLVLWGGGIIPAIVVLGFMTHMVLVLRDLEEPPTEPELLIEVIGWDWWWEIRYPTQGFETANELYIPVGRPVRFEVTSGDVIHAFWVPALQGKVDMIPGTYSAIWMQADSAGHYDGFCAEFCGLGHARMHLLLVAAEDERLEEWLEAQARPAREPEDPFAQEGAELFLDSGCGACHTVRGTEAMGRLGPDLTHMASRQEIGAGTLENTFGNLAAWIYDSQTFKPGNLMPSFPLLSGEELRAITTYIEAID